jgi:hypothetical protein
LDAAPFTLAFLVFLSLSRAFVTLFFGFLVMAFPLKF